MIREASSFAYEYQLYQHHLLKRYSFLNYLDILVKNNLTVKVVNLFLDSAFHSSICYPVQYHTVLITVVCNKFEIKQCVSSNFFFLQLPLVQYSGPLEFSCDTGISLSIYVVSWDFLKNCTESVDDSRTIAVLTTLSPLIHKCVYLSNNVGLQFLSTVFYNFQGVLFYFFVKGIPKYLILVDDIVNEIGFLILDCSSM